MPLTLDADLFFLESVPSRELDALVQVVTHDAEGNRRSLCMLSHNTDFKRHYPDHHRYCRAIAEEVQRYGSNTLATQLMRNGCGLAWRDILASLCGCLDLPCSMLDSAERLELRIIQMLLNILLEGVGDEQKKALVTYYGIVLHMRDDGLSMHYDIRPVITVHPELPETLCSLVAMLGGPQAVISRRADAFQNILETVRTSSKKILRPPEEDAGLAEIAASGAAGLALKGILAAAGHAGSRWDIMLPCAVIIGCLRQRARAEGWNMLGTRNEALQRGLELAQAFAVHCLKK